MKRKRKAKWTMEVFGRHWKCCWDPKANTLSIRQKYRSRAMVLSSQDLLDATQGQKQLKFPDR
jgi:hypothetical protein